MNDFDKASGGDMGASLEARTLHPSWTAAELDAKGEWPPVPPRVYSKGRNDNWRNVGLDQDEYEPATVKDILSADPNVGMALIRDVVWAAVLITCAVGVGVGLAAIISNI